MFNMLSVFSGKLCAAAIYTSDCRIHRFDKRVYLLGHWLLIKPTLHLFYVSFYTQPYKDWL